MLITGFPAQAFDTNCFVLATAPGEECVIVDPGIGVLEMLDRVLREHGLRPAAVMLTHGHLDHVFSVTPVCSARGVPSMIHDQDAYRLADPVSSLPPGMVEMLGAQFGSPDGWREPDDVRLIADGEQVQIAGLDFKVSHAPGHTEGSVMFSLSGAPDGVMLKGPDGEQPPSLTVLAGDVLFAGSIGRTDLPGGDHVQMMRSLRDVVLPLPDDALVLPGHGQPTTIGAERVTNPYLLEVAR